MWRLTSNANLYHVTKFPLCSTLVVYCSLVQHINQSSFTQCFIHNNCFELFYFAHFLFFNLNLTFAVYEKLRNSLNTQKKKGSSIQTLHCDKYQAIIIRLARQARLIIKEDYFFNSCRNFRIQWGSRDTPGCNRTWTGLHSFPRNERGEFCKCDEFWIVEQFF